MVDQGPLIALSLLLLALPIVVTAAFVAMLVRLRQTGGRSPRIVALPVPLQRILAALSVAWVLFMAAVLLATCQGVPV